MLIACCTGVWATSGTRRAGLIRLLFMHSASALFHRQALQLYTKQDNGNQLEFELRRMAVIDRYGR